MLFDNKRYDTPQTKIIVIPRGDDKIILNIKTVLNTEEMEKICPKPNPPTITPRGGVPRVDEKDHKYLEKLSSWGSKKLAWMIIQALSATEKLTWETVKLDDPETWENVSKEMTETFSVAEYNYILNEIINICGLSDSKIKEATESFLAGQATQTK